MTEFSTATIERLLYSFNAQFLRLRTELWEIVPWLRSASEQLQECTKCARRLKDVQRASDTIDADEAERIDRTSDKLRHAAASALARADRLDTAVEDFHLQAEQIAGEIERLGDCALDGLAPAAAEAFPDAAATDPGQSQDRAGPQEAGSKRWNAAINTSLGCSSSLEWAGQAAFSAVWKARELNLAMADAKRGNIRPLAPGPTGAEIAHTLQSAAQALLLGASRLRAETSSLSTAVEDACNDIGDLALEVRDWSCPAPPSPPGPRQQPAPAAIPPASAACAADSKAVA